MALPIYFQAFLEMGQILVVIGKRL